MLGLLIQAADVANSDITKAEIALVGTIVVALSGVIVAWINSRRVTKLGQNVGTANGKGNLVEMNEKQLEMFAQIRKSLDVHDEKLDFYGSLLLNHMATPGAHGGRDDRSDQERLPEHGRR